MISYEYFFIILVYVDLLIMLINLYVGRPNFYGKSKLAFCVGKAFYLILIFLHYYKYYPEPDFYYLYLFLHWCGDMFLLGRSDLVNAIGGFCFLLGHVLLIYKADVDYTEHSQLTVTISLLTITYIATRMFNVILRQRFIYKNLVWYGLVLWASTTVSAQKISIYKDPKEPKFYLEVIGKILFVISDVILTRDMSREKADGYTNIYNWPLYVTAEVLITQARILSK